MLAIVLALASAIGYGGSDFAAGLASRIASVIQVTLLATVAATVVVAAALPFAAAHRPSGAALAWGAAAGAGGTLGAFALYLGFRYAAFSVAGPLSAVGTAGFSVLAGLLWGERPSTLALIGIVLALPAIVGVSASAAGAQQAGETEHAGGEAGQAEKEPGQAEKEPWQAEKEPGQAEKETGQAEKEPWQAEKEGGGQGRPAAGVAAGLVAGGCFALLLIGLNRAGSGGGLWPVGAAEVTELAVAGAVAAATRNLRLPGGRPGWLAVIAGVAGAAGTILYFFASHDGFLAVTAVLTSLYPASTIVLARTLLGERLTGLRLTGLSLAGACVALIAAGGAG
jgi:drug/metabolite transporter (DMT)-like permease